MAHELAGASAPPRYTEAELDSISSTDLHARLERIDNETAQAIAGRLYSMAGIERLVMRTIPQAENAESDEPVGEDQHWVRQDNSLRLLAAARPQALLNKLRQMEGLDYGMLMVIGPQGIRERLRERPALMRLLSPPIRLELSEDIADALVRYGEFLAAEDGRLPWTQYIPYLPLLPALLCLAVLFPMTMLPKVFFALPMAIVMLLILGAGRFFSWFTNEDRLRKLALYITFTDEFVVEPEEDGEA